MGHKWDDDDLAHREKMNLKLVGWCNVKQAGSECCQNYEGVCEKKEGVFTDHTEVEIEGGNKFPRVWITTTLSWSLLI